MLLSEDHKDQIIRVLVCDDHDLVREALRAVINAECDMEVVGEASDAQHAILLAHALQPDAVLMDIEMPGLSGIEATRRITTLFPRTAILVLTVHDSNEYILRALEAGATGYLTKGILSREIPIAIRLALSGESTLSVDVLRKLIRYALQFSDIKPTVEGVCGLTERELAMLRLVANGYTNKMIGRKLNLSENTVKKYMMNVFEKLGVRCRTAAVIVAQNAGLLFSDSN